MRGYIRSYVLLEGLADTILYVFALFWLGMLVDWGAFLAFSFDWVQELDYFTGGLWSSFWVRFSFWDTGSWESACVNRSSTPSSSVWPRCGGPPP